MRQFLLILVPLMLLLGYVATRHHTLSGTAVGTFVQGQGTYLGTGYFDVFNCNGVETYATSTKSSYDQVKTNVQPKMNGCTWVKSFQGDRYNRATLPVVTTAVATST